MRKKKSNKKIVIIFLVVLLFSFIVGRSAFYYFAEKINPYDVVALAGSGNAFVFEKHGNQSYENLSRSPL